MCSGSAPTCWWTCVTLHGDGCPERRRGRRGANGARHGRLACRYLPMAVSIGINRGRVFAGPVGHPRRQTYSVTGDAVNLAARSWRGPRAVSGSPPVRYSRAAGTGHLHLDGTVQGEGQTRPVETERVDAVATAPWSPMRYASSAVPPSSPDSATISRPPPWAKGGWSTSSPSRESARRVRSMRSSWTPRSRCSGRDEPVRVRRRPSLRSAASYGNALRRSGRRRAHGREPAPRGARRGSRPISSCGHP